MIKKKHVIFIVFLLTIMSLIIPNITSLNSEIHHNTNQTMEKLVYDFTFVWMSDTQHYSQKYPYIFNNITEWITTNKYEKNITYVIHTGDIVQNSQSIKEWILASQSMKTLENNQVPYGVLAGNHDNRYGRFHLFYQLFFGQWRFNNKEFYGKSYKGNENHFDIISSNGIDFIILYLSYKIHDFEFNWANSILKQHKDKHAILALHEYIKKDGNYTGQGEEIFNKLVVPNSNIFMVLCGHIHDVERNVKNIDGRIVYEILANYQEEPNGGNGYLRMFHFSINDELIYVKTYSPYINDYNYHNPEDDEFVLVFN